MLPFILKKKNHLNYTKHNTPTKQLKHLNRTFKFLLRFRVISLITSIIFDTVHMYTIEKVIFLRSTSHSISPICNVENED